MSHSLIPTAHKQNPNPHMQQPSVTWLGARMVSISPIIAIEGTILKLH